MSSISVSKGSSVISSVLCVAAGFPEESKRAHWIYNINSGSLTLQVRPTEVIRRRPAEFMESSAPKGLKEFPPKQEIVAAK